MRTLHLAAATRSRIERFRVSCKSPLHRSTARVFMSTRALLAPVLKIANAYSEAAKSSPISTAVATAGVQTWAADGIAQLAVEKREAIDWRRSALFATFGVTYIGGFQYLLYSVAFVRWNRFFEAAGAATRLGAPVTRALCDQLGHGNPIMCT